MFIFNPFSSSGGTLEHIRNTTVQAVDSQDGEHAKDLFEGRGEHAKDLFDAGAAELRCWFACLRPLRSDSRWSFLRRCLCNSIDRYTLLKTGAHMTNMVCLSNSQLGHATATTRRQDILNPCVDVKFLIHINEADVSESLQASAPAIIRACKAPQILISGSRTPQRQRMVMRRFHGAPSLDKQRFLQEWSQVLPMLLTSKR